MKHGGIPLKPLFASAALKNVKKPSKCENEKGIKFLLQQREKKKKKKRTTHRGTSFHYTYILLPLLLVKSCSRVVLVFCCW